MFRRKPQDLDQSELAYERLSSGVGPYEPLPPGLQRFNRKQLLVYALLLVLVVAVFRDGIGRPPPEADGSCSRPAFAFDQTEVRVDGVVKWSVAGPTGSRVVVGADTTTVPTTVAEGKLLGPVALQDCKASGRFGVPLTDGEHQLRVFLIAPDGTVTTLGPHALTVNGPR